MSSNPPGAKTERIRHRIKEIELQPIRSKYPISVKLFVDNEEICELPEIKRGQDLRWARPIICRDVSPRAKVTLEICEIHTVKDRFFKSQAYVISEAQDRVEMTVGFAGTEWTAKLTMLTPATVGQSHADALKQLKETTLTPSALARLGKAQDVFQAVLDFGGIVAGAHPIAGLVFSLSTAAWERLKREDQLKGDTQKLLDGLTGIVDLAEVAKKNTKMKQLKDIIEEILILLEDIFIYIIENESKDRGGTLQVLRRAFDPSDNNTVQELLGRFEKLRADFDSGVGVDTHGMVHKLDLRLLLSQLQPVNSAGYSLDRACQAGTREHIIVDIMEWTGKRPDETSKPDCMLWIHGQAGIGKSSIASSICGKLKDANALAASFFCKRDGGSDLNDPLRLVNTITYSLANRCPEYAEAVAAVIEGDRELCMTNTLHDRYEGLIEKPLGGLEELAMSRPLIVLVDALDEFGTIESRKSVMELLSNMSQLVPWLKLVVTSRPDTDIEQHFEELDDPVSSRNVHDFDASDDIRAYFQKELDTLAEKRKWKWPEGSVDRLTEKAGGLFIWATTVKRHIEKTRAPDVAIKRLNEVLGDQFKHSDLDKLYEKVIKDGMMDTEDDNVAVFRQCIGVIIAVSTRRPLPLPDLCSILEGWEYCSSLEGVVEGLGAVLHVDEQMGGALRFYHQSFVDYVTSTSSSSNTFYVNPAERNAELAASCLKTMERELKFNICGLETSHLFNSQVPDLDERVKSNISNWLSYSCMYWISHLTGMLTPSLSKMEELLNRPRVLYWLEALSLLGRVDMGVTGLFELLNWLPSECPESRECVMDLYRFVSAFYDAISVSTPHLYVSALALAPESALVVRRLRHHFPNTVVVPTGGDKSWPDWLRTLAHPDYISSFAISSDGRWLVTGCADNAIRLWDIKTGAQVGEPLVRHSDGVTSVAFSPNSNLIAFGSDDTMVRMWDIETRAPIGESFTEHSSSVLCLAFSPNGDLIVSAGGEIRIWDVKTRATIGELESSGPVTSVAFSPNNELVVSVSTDGMMRIWDVKTHAAIGEAHSEESGITSIAFSPNSSIIVTGCDDNTVRIWDAKTCAEIGDPLVGHSYQVMSVAFSPSGDTIISGSIDCTVRKWNTETRTPNGGPLVGHSDTVTSVVFSPDGKLVVSASEDKTVRMWDAKIHPTASEPLVGHLDNVASVAFSPDGDIIASGSHDNTVRMWDAKTFAAIGEPLVGHTEPVVVVVFSPNAHLVVSGSYDTMVHIWDVRAHAMSGEPLVGHTGAVWAIAFSPDGDCIISGSSDNTVRMWDVKTRAPIGEPFISSQDMVPVTLSFSGDLIVSGSTDNIVRMWDVKTHAAVGELPVGDPEDRTHVAFSPDGDVIVSGSSDGLVRMWDVSTRALTGEPLVAHSDSVTSIAFLPKSNLIVSGSCDDTVRVWDVKTRVAVGGPLVGHSAEVSSVAISPNGELIVSGSYDKTMRIWNAKACDPTTSEISHPLNTFGLPPLTDHAGWTSFDNKSLFLWLPIRYRRTYDPRALYCASTDPAQSTIGLNFSKFACGTSWTSVASDSILRGEA